MLVQSAKIGKSRHLSASATIMMYYSALTFFDQRPEHRTFISEATTERYTLYMRQTLILLLFTLTANSLFACLSASQNRLFPLGLTSKGLCVVETHLYRTEFQVKDVLKIEPAWGGIGYFKIYDKNYQEVYSALIDTIHLFQQQHYDSIIGRTLKRGIAFAEKYPDFVAAKPVSITFCDYQEVCSKGVLVYDTLMNKISLQLSDKSAHEINVLFDSASIASNLLYYYSGFVESELSASVFKGTLYINSVRQFQISNKKLTIVHIGCGQVAELSDDTTYPPGKEYKPAFAFSDINKSVFEEPVLHHGHGFDFYIWE